MSPTWTPVCAVTAADPSLNLGAGPRRGRCRAALAIGVIAALDQLHIAQNVVNAILYAVLAGIAVVAVGGGGIRTMSQRWEDAAARYEAEKPRIAAAARSAPSLTDQGRHASPHVSGRPLPSHDKRGCSCSRPRTYVTGVITTWPVRTETRSASSRPST